MTTSNPPIPRTLQPPGLSSEPALPGQARHAAAGAPPPIITQDQVGVSVSAGRHSIDYSLPRHTTVASMMSDLVEKYRSDLENTGRDASYFTARTVSWHLERFGGTSIDPAGTLADAGVMSGDRIFLRRGQPTEVYPELIDDHAEFIAKLQTTQFASWSSRYSRPLASIVLLVCAALGLGGLVVFTQARPELDPLARYGTVAGLLICAGLIIAISLVSDYADDPQTQDVPKWGFWLGYALLAAAASSVIPRGLSIYTIIIVGVILATVAVVIYASTKRYPLIHVTVASAALLGIIAPLLSWAYSWAPMVIAAQAMVLGVIALKYSVQLALGLAKINLPYIAASGESYIKNLKGDVSQLPLLTKKDETLDSIFHQRERVAASRHASLAVTIGFGVIIAGAAFFVGQHQSGSWWLTAAFVVLVAITLMFRGLASADALLQTTYWVAATATILAFTTGVVVDNGLTGEAAGLIGGLTLISILSVIVSIRQISLSSNSIKRMIDIFEFWAFFLPFIILGYSFMGLYSLFRAW